MVVGGNGVSGQAFVDNAQFRDYTFKTFDANVLDMETAAIGTVAYSNGVPWIAGQALAADCRAFRAAVSRVQISHEAPRADCRCGVYGSKRLDHLRSIVSNMQVVRGETTADHVKRLLGEAASPNQVIAPERILALAFNKKARDEMQDRLERRGVRGVEVRTFHSFGYEIVREGVGWTFGGSTQKKTARALMKDAIQPNLVQTIENGAEATRNILTGFYLWRRDLVANMIGHGLVDFIANVLPKLFS